MNVRTLILAILRAKEASGYEIKKMTSEGPFSYFIDISFGSIYPTLARLEQEGLVDCRIESHPGKPDAKIYSITEKGRAELVNGLRQHPQKDSFKSEFLLQAMNADLTGPELLARSLAERIANLEADLEMLESIAADCDQPAKCWVVDYGRHMMSCGIAYMRKHKNQLISVAGGQDSDPQAAE